MAHHTLVEFIQEEKSDIAVSNIIPNFKPQTKNQTLAKKSNIVLSSTLHRGKPAIRVEFGYNKILILPKDMHMFQNVIPRTLKIR